ncbi:MULTISPECIES: glycosyltransferase family 4 protein [Brachybacterium]|uniref:Glycosyltransferase family 4 protein n=1 Tax=Brachybacterium epidermidis TaxID=2781983 RepID=A0ABR9W257_9MICO|nr:glycosyltransferase family 4 protein [Brachybacterium sp. p3-SID1565]MBE9403408.1 glycosyltransferase family 4 protein [Brachybacterium epidermidis]MCT1385975.1 glycosyltransferase family 4 protein [Brachybacterium sp. p3-SID1565]MCT1654829.1 glycosyltransferase family 4 protein [Brachybacterium muris]
MPSTRATIEALHETAPAAPTHMLGRPRDHRGLHRLALTIVHRALPALPSRDLAEAPWHFLADLFMNRSARRLLRTADLVDLQWEEYGRLAPLIRKLAPNAATTCMFHDVNEQKLSRAVDAAGDKESARKALRDRARNRRLLRRAAPALDRGFVLSEKDRVLLDGCIPGLPSSVVPPPLVDDSTPLFDVGSRPPVVGFVAALRRHENRDTALRLATHIWPLVRAARPDARLRIIGGGLEEGPRAQLSGLPGVELTGFVDDLDEAYSGLRATVSPIDRGAGVKFKVVESIVRGIPTLTTTVGAEGIDTDLFDLVSDDDHELAQGALDVLSDHDAAVRAHTAALRARATYGVDRFVREYLSGVEDAITCRRSRV